MSETRRKFDREYRDGAVRIVLENGKSIAAVARELGMNPGTLGNWCAADRAGREGTTGLSTGDVEELKRLRPNEPSAVSVWTPPWRPRSGPLGHLRLATDPSRPGRAGLAGQ